MIFLKVLFFNGGEIRDLLKIKPKLTRTISLFSAQWIDIIWIVVTRINFKVDLGAEACILGVKCMTSTFINITLQMF